MRLKTKWRINEEKSREVAEILAPHGIEIVGISEFPENVVEGSHVSVQGRLFAGTSSHDHTNFLMNVITLLPDAANPRTSHE